ncbi:HAD family hydrolase [Escherichia coli]|uniref:HAD family hydrolase n=1 Tax=Citrobacter portucalensis TaxID=1639133 RepID=A0ABZ0H4T4_9ENTR|nr:MULTISPECIES: HAD family hydrolase [Enterobacteriaceae]EMF0923736.1 HAD family hydrolase [Klebsiella aerogenes]MBE0003855.1 HAD family hydrolase [Citrobacter freundii]MBI0778806.1 HAD family hydrolase [Escherichia coli]MDE9573343.1 HAD family hydrolase [Citrobacter portucalensis]MDE9649960.1 HAD family hydrolase [Citrobacter portucalensis]
MKAILFDLDNTLFATHECNVYLRSHAGRVIISELIRKNTFSIIPLHEKISDYINFLDSKKDVDVFIVSDSPKDYCIAILEKFGIEIDNGKVLGSQHKPCIENEELFSTYDKILVVGDNPKDVYLAHKLRAASLYLTYFSEFNTKFAIDNSLPTQVVNDFDEMVKIITKFLKGELHFKIPYYKPYFLTVDADKAPLYEIGEEDIGYSMSYYPDFDELETPKERYDWFDIKRSVKPAKLLSDSDLDNKKRVDFYNVNKTITPGKAFRTVAWFAREDFLKWLIEKNITGKVYLVAAPSSVPRECNKSLPMEMLVYWWMKWFPHLNYSEVKLKNGCYVERYWPTAPAHMSKGKREVRPHLNTLGVFKDHGGFDSDTAAVVIVDDVVTSGTQMNAIATLLTGTGILPKGVKIYGYALAKTKRKGSSNLEKLIESFSKAEKSGG